MKNTIAIGMILFAFNNFAAAQACDCETLSGTLSANKTLEAENCYELSGCYTVSAGYTLTTAPGTVIFGNPGSALYIERDADILANGTDQLPIIFTSAQPVNSRDYGDWEGIYIAGKAENNRTNDEIELERACTIEAGGSVNSDNSGVFKYVQLHYSTYGLNLVGVGDATEVHHVQVTHTDRSAFNFYGGKVDVSNLVSYNAKEHDFFATYGYTGNMQFLLGFRQDVNAHVSTGSNGFYLTNDETGTSATPLTRPVVSNMTLLGPSFCSNASLSADFLDAVRFDENAAGAMYNSVLANWKEYGLFLNDAGSIAHTANDDLNFSFNSFHDNGNSDYAHAGSWLNGCSSSMFDWLEGSDPCSETGNELSPATTLGYDNMSICGTTADRDFALSSSTLGAPDFLSGDLSDPYFDDEVEFRGAFGGVDWTDDWANFAPQVAAYCEELLMKESTGNMLIMELAPNPTSGHTTLSFISSEEGMATLSILDNIDGRVLHSQKLRLAKGQQRAGFDASTLRTGVYILRFQTPTQTQHLNFIVR